MTYKDIIELEKAVAEDNEKITELQAYITWQRLMAYCKKSQRERK